MKKFTRDIKTAFTVSLLVFLTGMSQTTVAQINLPDLPLSVGSSVRPNIFFMLDDSRSMVHEVVWNDVDAGLQWCYFHYTADPLGVELPMRASIRSSTERTAMATVVRDSTSLGI